MAKLIRSVKECGNRQQFKTRLGIKIGFICLVTQQYCNPKKDNNFPDNCPLEEGIPVSNSCGKSHVHTYYKNGHRVMPPRTRKGCMHYNQYGVCTSFVCPPGGKYCIGVRCGYFKSVK